MAFPEATTRTRGLAASGAILSHAGSPLCLTVWGQRERVGDVRRKKGRREGGERAGKWRGRKNRGEKEREGKCEREIKREKRKEGK